MSYELDRCEEDFLLAWKNAALHCGPHFFGAKDNDAVIEATSKRELAVDWAQVELHADYLSRGIRILLAVVCGFYSATAAEAIFSELALSGRLHPTSWGVGSRSEVDGIGRRIIADLQATYCGW